MTYERLAKEPHHQFFEHFVGGFAHSRNFGVGGLLFSCALSVWDRCLRGFLFSLELCKVRVCKKILLLWVWNLVLLRASCIIIPCSIHRYFFYNHNETLRPRDQRDHEIFLFFFGGGVGRARSGWVGRFLSFFFFFFLFDHTRI